MSDNLTKPRAKTRTKTARPPLHKVILVNDDFTPREFVVRVLKAEFRITDGQAQAVMLTAHQKGSCVVAVYAKDIAETKAARATDAGRNAGYPLLFTTEPGGLRGSDGMAAIVVIRTGAAPSERILVAGLGIAVWQWLRAVWRE